MAFLRKKKAAWDGHVRGLEGMVAAIERSQAVIAFVRCPRSEMPAQVDLLAQAERFL